LDFARAGKEACSRFGQRGAGNPGCWHSEEGRPRPQPELAGSEQRVHGRGSLPSSAKSFSCLAGADSAFLGLGCRVFPAVGMPQLLARFGKTRGGVA